MNELEISKYVGVACASLLAFVGFGEISKALVSVHELEEPAYSVEIAEAETSDEPVVVASIGEIMALADVERGAKVFAKCKSCHKVDASGGNGVGPNLHAIVGRQIASVEGFNYSGALPADEDWSFDNLNAFLLKPKDWAPGTSMGFAGLKSETDRASVIAWLNEQSDSPLPMPE